MNLTSPKFSIVIPLYNKEATIGATLNDALQQTFTDFEILVVDDGSTDNSLHVVRQFNDERIKIFTKNNGGVSSARNLAINKAKGELIAFLDADDWWQPDYLMEMNELTQDFPFCSMYACAYKKITRHHAFVKGNEMPYGLVKDFFKTRLEHQIPFTSATIVRNKIFQNVGGFPEGMAGGEDDYTWTKIALQYRVAFLPLPLVAYNFINNSIALRKGKLDTCNESWFDFEKDADFYLKEFIAQKAIHAGIRYALGGPQNKSSEIEKRTMYNTLSKKEWKYLYFLNRIPRIAMPIYKVYKMTASRIKNWLNSIKGILKYLLGPAQYKVGRMQKAG